MTKIEIFPWNTNFETGIPIIDEQHKGLIDLLNLLVSHIAFQSDAPTLNVVFDELKAYTINHFSTEEAVWERYFHGDPWIEWHKHAHVDFITEVVRMKEETDKPLDDIIEEIVKFLTHWLAFHILDSDKRMAIVVLALPSGMSMTQAKIRADAEMSGSTRILIETIMGMYDQLANRTVQVTKEINKRKKVEEELKLAKEKAEAANIAKSMFISNMSHELRTPLNAILGFSELMSLDVTASAKQKETLAIINHSGAYLLGMINDVLDISKIEAGHLEVDIHAFDLIKLLQDIGELMNVRASNKQLFFSLELATTMQRFVKTDSGKLRQILINLLGNAIKFTSQGEITLRACTQSFDAIDTVMLVIEVIDTGMGIPVDKQDALFKPFVQLFQDNSNAKGTGLGLSISKSLVELMEGRISVISELDVGSTFKIELPVVMTDASDISVTKNYRPVKSLAPNQSPWRLLVVDDNFENRLLLTTLLCNIGFEVREAENGQEAISIFEQWQPHLIWMDMRMPVMDGYEAAAQIRQRAGGDKVKILALTASVFKEQHQCILNAGCDAVLHKPFHLPEIFAALTQYLGVKFIYQEDSATLAMSPTLQISAEMMTVLPVELRQQLHEAALKLDTEETDAIITEIRAFAPNVAASLDELAKTYQFEQIIQLTYS
jgi:hemerythrin-like metal-binding protein